MRLAGAIVLGSSSLHAAEIVWDGGGDGVTFDQASNWAGDVLPSPVVPNTAVFDGSVGGVLSLAYGGGLGGAAGNLGINLLLASGQTSAVSLDSGAVTTAVRVNNITLSSGSGAFTLGNGSDVFNMTLGGAGGQTHTWTNDSANAATIRSDVRFGLGGGGNHALLFAGSGNWVVDNLLTPTNASSLSIQKIGSGELILSGGGSLNNTGSPAVTAFGGAFGATFKEGTTRVTAGTYAFNSREVVVGGLDTVGTNTRLIMDAGSFTGIGWFSIGRGNGTGVTSSDVILNNNASIAAADLAAGMNGSNAATAPRATLTLNASSSVTVSNAVNIGESANSHVTFNINGTSTFSQTANSASTRLGIANGAVGIINVNGGTASFHRDLVVGTSGTGSGSVVLNSGTVDMATTEKRWLIINQNNASTGQVVVNGGSFNLNTNTDLRFGVTNTAAGTNVVTLNGGSMISYSDFKTTANGAGVVDMMQSGTATANNTFNLNGGVLAIRQVLSNTNNGTRTFNFNGGTLRATGDSAAFFNLGTGSAFANVRDGGAIIDTNGFNVTVAQALQHSNIVGDQVIDGGLTKNGTGTLNLNGVNSFTGLTTVNAGTLALGVTGSIDSSSGVRLVSSTFDVSAKDGGYTVARLNGSGNVIGALTVSTEFGIGSSIGSLNVGGSLTLGNGGLTDAVFAYDVFGGSSNADLGTVRASTSGSGTLNLNGVALDLVQLGTFTQGQVFTLFGYQGGLNGTFAGLSEGSSFTDGGGEWLINYRATTPGENWQGDSAGLEFVNITAVPEPSVVLLSGLGALALLRRRRSH
jgi:autotransporter-associated beta strand protein